MNRVLPYVVTEVMGCPTVMVKQQILRAAIEMCNMGRVLRYEHPDITTVASQRDYTFSLPLPAVPEGDPPLPTEYAVSAILEAFYEDSPLYPYDGSRLAEKEGPPLYYARYDVAHLSLFPWPDSIGTVRLLVALRPLPTASSLDDALIEHVHTIAAGAKYFLMSMPGQKWSNPDMASYYKQQFYSELGTAGLVAGGPIEVQPCV
jgi:hypothetical protein